MTFHIKVTPRGVEVEFDAGSIEEAAGIIDDAESAVVKLMTKQFGNPADMNDGASSVTIAQGTEAPKGRGRPRKDADKGAPPPPAPVTATAPAPIPVGPTPAEQVAAATGKDGLDVPAFLDRRGEVAPPAPPAAPPPPPMPAAPSLSPAVSILGGKVADALTERAKGTADNGAALVAWCRDQCGLPIVTGASFDEAMSVLRFTGDDKMAPAAKALGVS